MRVNSGVLSLKKSRMFDKFLGKTKKKPFIPLALYSWRENLNNFEIRESGCNNIIKKCWEIIL